MIKRVSARVSGTWCVISRMQRCENGCDDSCDKVLGNGGNRRVDLHQDVGCIICLLGGCWWASEEE